MAGVISFRRDLFTRFPPCRRTMYYLMAILTTTYAIIETYNYFKEDRESFSTATEYYTEYNELIQDNGTFLPYESYKILQFVKKPFSEKLTEFHDYLQTQDELKQYFTLAPRNYYHITLADLKNDTILQKKDFQKLTQEQRLLDKTDTHATGDSKDIYIIHTREIRMDIELTSNYADTVKKHRQRWSTEFPQFTSDDYTPFYITIAYQYRHVPNETVLKEFNRIIKDWEGMPYNIELEPITICSYKDMNAFTPIIPRTT